MSLDFIVRDGRGRPIDRRIEAERALADRFVPLDIFVYTPKDPRSAGPCWARSGLSPARARGGPDDDREEGLHQDEEAESRGADHPRSWRMVRARSTKTDALDTASVASSMLTVDFPM